MKNYNSILYLLISISAGITFFGKSVCSAEQTEVKHNITKGKSGYISVEDILPGRARYTMNNLNAKLKHQRETGLQYDSGRSSLKAPLSVINSPYGYILVDSLEEALAAPRVGAQTVPIKVIDDLSALSEKEFFKEALNKGYIYPYGLTGEAIDMLHAKDNVQSDPLLWFANIIARKCNKSTDLADKSFTQAKHPSYAKQFPVYVIDKSNIAEKFMEFRVAEQLRAAGLVYTDDMGNDPSHELVEQARQILRDNPIDGLRLIPEKTDYLKVNKGNICTQPVYEQEMHILPYFGDDFALEEIIVEQ